VTRGVADSAVGGRSCPYCRFPVKAGVSVEQCDACSAVHHEECWAEGGGCAVLGCPNGGVLGRETAATRPAYQAPVPPAYQPPPGWVQPGPAQAPARGRSLWVGIGVGLALAAVAVGAFLLLGRGDDGRTTQVAPPPPPTSEAVTTEPAPPPEPPPPPEPSLDEEIARELQSIVEFSIAGRDAVRSGRYAAAIANRRAVLRRLRALQGATGPTARAKATLEGAMEASLQSDLSYAAGADASATDAEATRLKSLFVEQFAPISRKYGLASYGPGDF
jgi:hypothetical protein